MKRLQNIINNIEGITPKLKVYRDNAINIEINKDLIIMTPSGRPLETNIQSAIKLVKDYIKKSKNADMIIDEK